MEVESQGKQEKCVAQANNPKSCCTDLALLFSLRKRTVGIYNPGQDLPPVEVHCSASLFPLCYEQHILPSITPSPCFAPLTTQIQD